MAKSEVSQKINILLELTPSEALFIKHMVQNSKDDNFDDCRYEIFNALPSIPDLELMINSNKQEF